MKFSYTRIAVGRPSAENGLKLNELPVYACDQA